ncbi:alpha-ketoglutarate-dependent dioxygenase AlkB family protein [Gilvimarinus sp. F26214L]|uniref:alpha-ketoglutarate-dependent dioxygenase AlkB family protein n=1 Tax=Gilvimarinus sp. DZF01 TaxID=3461371 RepID=UPI004045ED7E
MPNPVPFQSITTDPLFPTEDQSIVMEGGELLLIRGWLDTNESSKLFSSLRRTIAWEQSTIRIAGRPVQIPRLNAWYGDPGCGYRYSGTDFEPHPWTPELQTLRERVQTTLAKICPGFHINSALLNLYRDGADSVGWHSDNEPELGPRPQIASVSLGGSRRFVFKHRRDKGLKHELLLESGSLLLMLGDTQRNWVHALPKTRKPVQERINITLRQIIGPVKRER